MPRGNVRVKIDADVRDLKRGVDQANRHLDGFGKTAGRLAKLGGAVFAVDGLSQAFSDVMAEAQEARKVTAQTEAVLKSTGGAAGVTAREVERLAGVISRKTAIDDEQIQRIESAVLETREVFA